MTGGHLVRRFATSLSSRPPSAAAGLRVACHWLMPSEAVLWGRLSNADRRHAIGVTRRFLARRSASRAEIAGALLHDVGKLDAGLGTWGAGRGHVGRSACW